MQTFVFSENAITSFKLSSEFECFFLRWTSDLRDFFGFVWRYDSCSACERCWVKMLYELILLLRICASAISIVNLSSYPQSLVHFSRNHLFGLCSGSHEFGCDMSCPGQILDNSKPKSLFFLASPVWYSSPIALNCSHLPSSEIKPDVLFARYREKCHSPPVWLGLLLTSLPHLPSWTN